ncbi:MAG TPA: CehA/McbA family metallohydrolase [Vicinamibacterales bacterium]|nr:CehA/McbA family metallohydrolase [Vicinamibacterales bacterium]
MMSRPRLALLMACGAVALAAAVLPAEQAFPASPATPASLGAPGQYFKGNLHAHTLNSDGDSTPDDVVRWYREHGYHFVALTDHNYLTSVDGLNAVHGADQKFVIMKGEEVTDRFENKPIHVNGLNPSSLIKPAGGSSVLDMTQRMIDSIRAAGAVPSVNHPNFGWAITADEMLQLHRTRLFEVFNGHPLVNNLGGGGVPGLEEVWDRILSSGKMIYGVAVDDAHYFKRPEDTAAPRPGFGWVYIRAPRLDASALVESLERGDFYSSTGVELHSLTATGAALTIAVKTEPQSKYRIQFIGRQGRVLREFTTTPATYTFKGDESYVRAKIIESNGKLAWVQPVPVGASAPK